MVCIAGQHTARAVACRDAGQDEAFSLVEGADGAAAAAQASEPSVQRSEQRAEQSIEQPGE